jgi:hypothetical protein
VPVLNELTAIRAEAIRATAAAHDRDPDELARELMHLLVADKTPEAIDATSAIPSLTTDHDDTLCILRPLTRLRSLSDPRQADALSGPWGSLQRIAGERTSFMALPKQTATSRGKNKLSWLAATSAGPQVGRGVKRPIPAAPPGAAPPRIRPSTVPTRTERS